MLDAITYSCPRYLLSVPKSLYAADDLRISVPNAGNKGMDT